VWSPKGTTLRVIRCPTLQVSQFLFPGQRSDTLLIDHVCTTAFLDIQQAFDRVWHHGLLYKLKATLPTPYYLLLKFYLADRYSQIKFNTATSANFPIHSGVPQGSVLCPLLYLVFTADIPTRNDTVIAIFSDDTDILASNEDSQTASQSLQTHLNNLESWLNTWCVKINGTMSTHVTFTTRRTDCPAVKITEYNCQ
jgi:hypothetical protein